MAHSVVSSLTALPSIHSVISQNWLSVRSTRAPPCGHRLTPHQFLEWNISGLRTRVSGLRRGLLRSTTDILGLQDTNAFPSENCIHTVLITVRCFILVGDPTLLSTSTSMFIGLNNICVVSVLTLQNMRAVGLEESCFYVPHVSVHAATIKLHNWLANLHAGRGLEADVFFVSFS